jgi:(p)ppGpp synthase/HD superfamily hydrolase
MTRLASQQDFPRHEGNVCQLLQELDRRLRGTTIEAEFQSIRDSFADVQRRLSMIEEKFGNQLDTILSELEKMAELVKQPSQKRPSNQRAFMKMLIMWIAVKSISFRSDNCLLFQEMVQRANPDFSVPVYTTLKYHIKCLAEVSRQ